MKKPILVYLSLSNLLLNALMLVASTTTWSNWFHIFTARRTYASVVLGVVILFVCLSVCLSVFHTRAL